MSAERYERTAAIVQEPWPYPWVETLVSYVRGVPLLRSWSLHSWSHSDRRS
jgi:hypothetical protein